VEVLHGKRRRAALGVVEDVLGCRSARGRKAAHGNSDVTGAVNREGRRKGARRRRRRLLGR
jgi:hypothetical protein